MAGVSAPGVGASGIGADRLGGVRPNVHVTVPVMTLLGKSNEPGQLDGYGPIAPSVARELAARAPSFIRLLTHPETGAVLSVGRDSYTVPADLKRVIRLRDETCTGIGCNKPATICDIDHVLEWQNGGETKLSNNTPECKQHHMIRHHTTWQIRLTDNQVEWVSPLGYTYRVPRASNVQFAETAPVVDEAAGDGNDIGDDGDESANVTTEYADTPPF
ncbi:HNH endonuclease [Microbacterium sp. MPKO10]|nr:HNH endonuclease signature motif containing protein [Microbacterium sp. MPKO10]MCW4457019.1 HNH endonuclease [Microbacterium sp. MPKO10]